MALSKIPQPLVALTSCHGPERSGVVWLLTSVLLLPSRTSSSYTGPLRLEHGKLFPTSGILHFPFAGLMSLTLTLCVAALSQHHGSAQMSFSPATLT